jgi:DNA mismatch repair protein MutS2
MNKGTFSASHLNAIRAVEWEKFLELAEKEAFTTPGKDLIRQLIDPHHWAADVGSAQLMQAQTQEMTPLLDRNALWGPLHELTDPQTSLDRLARGSVLEATELAALRRWLFAVDSWSQIPREDIRGERFKKTLSSLPDPLNILRILEKILTPEGELSENASEKLSRLFSDIRTLKREINHTLDSLIKSFSQRGILQETFSDVRDGRYVVPVKIASQNEIDGIIYESSASGQTVFIEPQEISPLNNRLRQKENELIQEVFQILSDASKNIQPFVPEIQQAIAQLTHWDFVQAKARLGRHYSGKVIQVTPERKFRLHQTAHPLLWWSLPAESIIRNQIDFGPPFKTLLLTGPNTGGKTVLLKTLGIAGICSRTGFPFPGVDHPEVPFFESFFADLGDPQSIAQHVSSFSGHVLKFKEILENTTDQSLILIDELNSATDPEEGAAFGRAILETIMKKNSMIVTTSHDPHLKAFAMADPRMINASMAFDESSKSPTYQMLIGVPGRSRALETASRLGIPEEVIQLARSYLSREHNDFEKTLAQLEGDRQEATQAKAEALAALTEADRLKKEWSRRVESSVGDLLDRTRQKLRRILEQTQDDVRSFLQRLDENKNRSHFDQTRSQLDSLIQEASTQINSTLQNEDPEIAEALSSSQKQLVPQSEPLLSTFKVGSKVRIPKWKTTGTILEVTPHKVKVAMGNLQMTLSPSEIEVLHSSQQNPPPVRISISEGKPLGGSVEPRIDLRGTRLDEAMSQLESFLDLNFRTGFLQEVTIVHGLGSGALREGAHRLLAKLPYIRSFRDGGAGNGGSGATIVEFDRT